MSNITFQCTSCEADFEVGITLILERPTAIKCTHCGNRPSSNRCHSFAQALDDLLSSMASLRSKVQFELNLDTDILPPPYGPSDDESGGSASTIAMGLASSSNSDDDDDDEEDDDDDFDDDDDDFDDDDFEFDDDDEEEEDDEEEDQGF